MPPPAERASNLVRQAVAAGTTAFRSHADIGLRHVEALLEVKAAFTHAADFQIVAFPQYGVLANRDLASPTGFEPVSPP